MTHVPKSGKAIQPILLKEIHHLQDAWHVRAGIGEEDVAGQGWGVEAAFEVEGLFLDLGQCLGLLLPMEGAVRQILEGADQARGKRRNQPTADLLGPEFVEGKLRKALDQFVGIGIVAMEIDVGQGFVLMEG